MRLAVLVLVLPLLLGFETVAEAGDELTIIHTNDLHSHLVPFAPELDYTPATGDDRTLGGWARIATLIAREKRLAGPRVLVLDGGDFLIGSLFHLAAREEAFELRLMKTMGYDAATLGNHEFDLRPWGLARMIQAAEAKGGLPQLLCANLVFDGDPREATLHALVNRAVIRRYTVLEKGGLRVGVFGLIGRDAAEVAPFKAPVRIGDPQEAAREMVKILRGREKADIVICLSHGGWNKVRARSEDESLAAAVPGIDIIIGGHTHTALERPIVAGNTIVVQAGEYGQHVGVLKVRRDNGRLTMSDYRLVAIDDSLPGDPAVQGMVDSAAAIVDRNLLSDKGLTARAVIAHTAFDLDTGDEETNLGNLVADSIRWYVNRHDYDARDPVTKAVVAVESNGVIRDAILKGRTGNITVSDAFRALSLGIGLDDTPGYPLISFYLTGAEIKKALEIVTSLAPDRLLSARKGPNYFLQVSGLTFTVNPNRMIFDRVTDIRIGSDEEGYAPLDYSAGNRRLYRVVANIYNATFLKVVGGFTWHVLDIVPKDRNGVPIGAGRGAGRRSRTIDDVLDQLSACRIDADKKKEGVQELKEWSALVAYLESFPDADGDGMPDVPERYRRPAGRMASEASVSPIALVARPGTPTLAALIIAAPLVLVVVVPAAVFVRRRTRTGRQAK